MPDTRLAASGIQYLASYISEHLLSNAPLFICSCTRCFPETINFVALIKKHDNRPAL